MAKAKKVEGGTVMFNLGLTIPGPVAYSSVKIDLGMTLPILPGEDVEDAMTRVQEKAVEALEGVGEGAITQASDFLGRKATAAKTPGR